MFTFCSHTSPLYFPGTYRQVAITNGIDPNSWNFEENMSWSGQNKCVQAAQAENNATLIALKPQLKSFLLNLYDIWKCLEFLKESDERCISL